MIAGALARFDVVAEPERSRRLFAFALALKAGVFVKLATQAQWTNRRSAPLVQRRSRNAREEE